MAEFGSDLIGQRQVRIEKARKLKDLGIDPYPSKSHRTNSNREIVENFEAFEGKEVTVAGRLMTLREHGKIVFGNIQDPTGRIQLYIKEEDLNPTDAVSGSLGFQHLELVDLGDIVEATGKVVKTQRGEISILPARVRILTKALRPLPEKWSGLKDKETIFRKRYLDTIMNPDKKAQFEYGAKLVFAIREFLNNRGFLEIKTPIIQPVYGGGSAKPFKTHVNALGVDYYLAIAHELYLKRLITAGFENVYNIAGYFRNEGIDRTHNPEFNMLETMTAYKNYEFNMDLIEEMYRYIGQKVFDRTVFKVQGQDVDFGQKWERIQMIDAVKKYAGYDFNQVKTLDEAHKVLREINYADEMPLSIGESMVKVFEEKVEEKLIQPTFVYGHPVEISPLAKKMSEDSRFVERFEIFIGGIEGGDNWTELNDPLELYDRFKSQVEKGRAGSEEFHPMDIDFIETMEYGMPPTTGLGPGIERLIMMYTESEYIDDVMFFPMLKPAQVTDQQREIYGSEYLEDPLGTGKKAASDSRVSDPQEIKSQDKSRKMVLVINKDLEGWQLTNTVGHLSAFLGNMAKEEFVSRSTFTTTDGEVPSNSQYPIISLAANEGQMFNFLQKVEESGLVYMAYTQEMLDYKDDVELADALKDKKKSELRYLGIGVFGKNDEIDAITKKFSMWK